MHILELVPYRSRRYLIPGRRGVERTCLLMVEIVSSVHF
jgi:hypothetical protein